MGSTEKTRPATGTIVPISRFKSGKSLSPLHQAEAYWSALRCDGDVPLRSSIDPRGLQPVLPHVFILQRIAPGLARFRLAGRHLNDLAGMEVRGMPLGVLFAAPARAGLADALKAMFDTPAIAELSLCDAARPGSGEARVLLLPMKCDMGEINRALGVFLADPETSPVPRRFDLVHSRLRPIPGLPGTDTPPIPQPGFAQTRPPQGANAPHLRLVRTTPD